MNMQYDNKRIISPLAITRSTDDAETPASSDETSISANAMTRKPIRGYPLAKRNGRPQHRKPHLLYQPQIDMFNGKIAGAEALVRWGQSERSMLSSNVPTSQLGCLAMEKAKSEWVIRKACTQASLMNREGLPSVHTTIRLSAQQLMDPRLDGYIRESISDAAIRPELIECGISESTLLENHQALTPVLRKLAKNGVRIAVCDFGSDRSALSYPKQFPVNALRIDHSFFWRFASWSGAAEIVASILAMATRQGLDVVACGVQERKQIVMLYQNGCGVMQGNFLCRPLPLDTLKTALREMGGVLQQPPHGGLHAGQRTAA